MEEALEWSASSNLQMWAIRDPNVGEDSGMLKADTPYALMVGVCAVHITY